MNGEPPETIPMDGDILARLEEIESAAAWMQEQKEARYYMLHNIVDSVAQILAKFMKTE